MVDEPKEREPVLKELLARLDCSELDLVLVEGFRHLAFPKIELHRGTLHKPTAVSGRMIVQLLRHCHAIYLRLCGSVRRDSTAPTQILTIASAIADFEKVSVIIVRVSAQSREILTRVRRLFFGGDVADPSGIRLAFTDR